jgi:ubiquinone/menaquinone biosynthesis C-methylase UbiE
MYHRSADRFKKLLYDWFGVTLPKLKNQRNYWESRGHSYMDDFFLHGHGDREIFFQDILFHELQNIHFDSIFEAGCGFGWNIKRCKDEYPSVFVSGLDFSWSQLHLKAKDYLVDTNIQVVNGNNCAMPYKNDAFDVGFSLGVFMNIHSDFIIPALEEMARVCRKYIIHLEWNSHLAGNQLKRRRAHKTNIVSHDYDRLYSYLGHKVVKVMCGREFEKSFEDFERRVERKASWWAGYEGPDKYSLYVIQTIDID